jgi:hypothetical protein
MFDAIRAGQGVKPLSDLASVSVTRRQPLSASGGTTRTSLMRRQELGSTAIHQFPMTIAWQLAERFHLGMLEGKQPSCPFKTPYQPDQ